MRLIRKDDFSSSFNWFKAHSAKRIYVVDALLQLLKELYYVRKHILHISNLLHVYAQDEHLEHVLRPPASIPLLRTSFDGVSFLLNFVRNFLAVLVHRATLNKSKLKRCIFSKRKGDLNHCQQFIQLSSRHVVKNSTYNSPWMLNVALYQVKFQTKTMYLFLKKLFYDI